MAEAPAAHAPAERGSRPGGVPALHHGLITDTGALGPKFRLKMHTHVLRPAPGAPGVTVPWGTSPLRRAGLAEERAVWNNVPGTTRMPNTELGTAGLPPRAHVAGTTPLSKPPVLICLTPGRDPLPLLPEEAWTLSHAG